MPITTYCNKKNLQKKTLEIINNDREIREIYDYCTKNGLADFYIDKIYVKVKKNIFKTINKEKFMVYFMVHDHEAQIFNFSSNNKNSSINIYIDKHELINFLYGMSVGANSINIKEK